MRWLRTGVALLIIAVWAAGFLISYFNHNFQVPGEWLTPPMLIASGFLFGRELKDAVTKRNGKDDR